MSAVDSGDRRVPAWLVLAEACGVWLMFFGYSVAQATVPGVNETHYLSKARHVWNPDWCAGDLFLESSNPHLVFYRTVGWLAAVTDFETAAYAMRAVCLAVLALGWLLLTTRVCRRAGVGVLSAAGFLLLSTLGNWSGEWVVGGAESKVPSYGFALAAVGLMCDRRLRWAGLFAGLSVSMHPVVGAWASLAILGAVIADRRRLAMEATLTDWLVAGGLFVAASLPGVLPALAALGGSPEESVAASRYQVTKRLSHHLNPAAFPPHAYRGFLLLCCLGAVLWSMTDERRRGRMMWVVSSSVVFAAVGVAVGLSGDLATSDWRVFLLKFYPFRLADAVLPIGVCVLLADYGLTRLRGWKTESVPFAVASAALSLLFVAFAVPAHDRDSSRMSARDREDWVRTLTWVRENTPADALILSTDSQWAVRWFAQRPEYVNYKDCPQDPASLAEWRRRRGVMYQWSKAALADGIIEADELHDFGERTGVTHLISGRFGPFETTPVFRSGRFRIVPTGAEESQTP